MKDSINPKHYTELAISPLEYIEANQGEFDWAIANVIKYVSRYKRKNGIEDLEKARWYLNHQIELEKARQAEAIKNDTFATMWRELSNNTEDPNSRASIFCRDINRKIDDEIERMLMDKDN